MKRDADKKKANTKLWTQTERQRTSEMATASISRQRTSDKITVLASTAIPRSPVENARNFGFSPNVEVLPGPIMLYVVVRSERDKHKCSATKMLMSTVVFCRPDQYSLTNCYVDDNSCLISE
jgi:hypothetical protein